jgi:P-type Cu2+ transporter
LLSGESRGLPKYAGDGLLAGSVNLQAPLEMRVSRVGADTRFEGIVALMRDAAGQRPAAAGLADRWAAPFLWAVLLLAAAAAAAWSVIDPARAVAVGVAVLIVTCPCALWLATPATLVAAASGLASRGVLLRRVAALETLAQVDTVFIDKTGTLSVDRPRLCGTLLHWPLAPALDASLALRQAASVARWSSHPLSASMVEAAGEFDDSAVWSEIEETPGAGLSASDALGRRWRLGSAVWVGDGVAGSDGAFGGGADQRVWLRCDDTVVASFEFSERLRPGAAQAIAALHADGVHVMLLSGDDEARTQAFAAAAGVDVAVGAASPEHKLGIVQAAQRAGSTVLMVGDGLNDAPVLAAANVSMAMGQGALTSRSVADAVIVSGEPGAIVDARRVARHTMRIVRQNLAWAAAYNAACIPLALAGALPPWAAGLGMATSSLLVMLNAQRAARAQR